LALRVDQLELVFRSSCLGLDYGDRFTVDPADLTLAAVNELGLWCVRKHRPSLKRTTNLELERTRGIRLFN
jgi:hypothetical protein